MDPPRKRPRLSLAESTEPDIEALRQEHDRRFLGRLDGILQKYDRDFEGISDEIDLNTGRIVVDNGHVQRARDAYDIGPPARRGGGGGMRASARSDVQERLVRRQSSSNALAREIHNVVHHHYAPELHQNVTQPLRETDLASSMLQILSRIERMEARNERLHIKLMDRLAPTLVTPQQSDITRQVRNDQTPSPRPSRRESYHDNYLAMAAPDSPNQHSASSASPPRELSLVRQPKTISRPAFLLDPEVSIQEIRANDKRRTWTAADEQKVRRMREEGRSFTEIAKEFPSRTRGSIKIHWYKSMQHADTTYSTHLARPQVNRVHVDRVHDDRTPVNHASVDRIRVDHTPPHITPRRGDIWAPVYMSSPELRAASDSDSSDDDEVVHGDSDGDGDSDSGNESQIQQEPQSGNPDSPNARDPELNSSHDSHSKESNSKDRWKQEEDDYIMELVKGELGEGAKAGKWNRIIAAFIQRYPNRRGASIKPRFARVVPGGISAVRESLQQQAPASAQDSRASVIEGATGGSNDLEKARDVFAGTHAPEQDSSSSDADDDDASGQESADDSQAQRQARINNLFLDVENKWSFEEMQRLARLCAGIPRGQRIRGAIEKHFPDRSFRSIQSKLQKLRKAGRIPVPPDPRHNSLMSEPELNLQEALATIRALEQSGAVSHLNKDSELARLKRLVLDRQEDDVRSATSPQPGSDPNKSDGAVASSHSPTKVSPVKPAVQPAPSIVPDSEESEPPSTLELTQRGETDRPETPTPVSGASLLPRKRGRPSKTNSTAEEVRNAVQSVPDPTMTTNDPPKLVEASPASAPATQPQTKTAQDAAKVNPRKPAAKRPARKSEPLIRSMAAGKTGGTTTPSARKHGAMRVLSKPARPAFATPQMSSRHISTPTAYSAPPGHRTHDGLLADDLSEDELA